MTESSSEA